MTGSVCICALAVILAIGSFATAQPQPLRPAMPIEPISERGGKNAKKRAAVAVARKLAVLLHRLWVSGEVYEPLGYASSRVMAQQAA